MKEVLKLKAGFTTARESQLKNYLASAEAVSAYFQYYLPTNFPKLQFLFEQVDLTYWESLKGRRWIDYGAGPGTYSAALLSLPVDLRPSEIIVIDHSALMLSQAEKFLTQVFPTQKFKFLSSLPQSLSQEKESVLFFGNSLNEMKPEFAQALLKNFQGEDLLWIEPGTMDSFQSLVRYRQDLIHSGYQVVYPCANSCLTCPALTRDVAEWCHQVLRLTHPDWLERLSQKMQIDRKEMPMTAHIYSKHFSAQAEVSRVVRIRLETKHSLEWDVCRTKENSQELEWKRLSVVKKNLSKSEQKVLAKMSTGLSFRFDKIKDLGDGTERVELKK